MSESRWIVIDRWDDFQHYKNRQPSWIKVYTELLDDPNYRALSFFHRGLLHGIWLLYARARQAVPASPAYIAHRLGGTTEADDRKRREAGDSLATGGRLAGDSMATSGREPDDRPVRARDLKRLEQAGFIRITDSKPLARAVQRASPEKRREEKETRAREQQPPTNPFACPECGQSYGLNSEHQLAEHLEHVHWIVKEKML